VVKETNKWLAAQRDGRFTFVFTPKHGFWLNFVEGFFSKMARWVLRRIRVASNLLGFPRIWRGADRQGAAEGSVHCTRATLIDGGTEPFARVINQSR
jgi:hypothetical protein